MKRFKVGDNIRIIKSDCSCDDDGDLIMCADPEALFSPAHAESTSSLR